MSPFIRLAAPAVLVLGLCPPVVAQTAPGPAATPPSALFSDLQGADIRGAGDRRVATLEDVIVDGEGRIVEVVLGEGGLFGLGRKLHLLDARQLPELGRMPISAADMTAEQIAALPVYDADDPPDSVGPSPLVRAAPPGAVGSPVPATPGSAAPKPADDARAAGATSVEGETSAAGSGSGGMVPQQGTGSGATQVAPGANEGEARPDDGSAAVTPEQARLNAEYGRDKAPASHPMPQDNADAAVRPAGAAPGGRTAGAASPRIGGATGRWRLGDLVDADVRGPKDGIEIEDFRIENGRVADVILSKSLDARSEDVRAVSFDALILGGEPQDPEVALEPSADGRPIGAAPRAVGK